MAGRRPPNFSWVLPGVLAGSGLPTQAAHLHYMVAEGVRHLVSLTEWRPPLHTCASKGEWRDKHVLFGKGYLLDTGARN